ncbi:30s ribosomal protein s1 [Quercus suber]|uniref:30s ribosomal protein s1 n=1 Tax=Quercus suber TaxID=58331 RepID=A0AAW0LXW9_QUESU
MDGLIGLTNNTFFTRIIHSFSSTATARARTRTRTISLTRKSQNGKFIVSASKEGDTPKNPKLDRLDQMELNFGQLLGEDPKLTLAKIMGRKANPDASYLEIEKKFYKKKGKLVEIKEVPFDGSKEVRTSSSLDGLDLVRPVPKKGFAFKADDKPMEKKKPSKLVGKAVGSNKSSIPNVILRKPTVFNEDDVGEKPSRLRIKPNLSLKMGNGQMKDRFSDMTLLRKPEPVTVNQSIEKKQEPCGNVDDKVVDDLESKTRREEANDKVSDFALLKKPEPMSVNTNLENNREQFRSVEVTVQDDIEENALSGSSEFTATANTTKKNYEEIMDGLISNGSEQDNDFVGLQSFKLSDMGSSQEITALSDTYAVDSRVKLSMEAALQGKPKRLLYYRLDQSVKRTQKSTREETVFVNSKGDGDAVELNNLVATSPLEESGETDWTKAEDLVKTGNRGEVELISCSTRGFVVSFGSLVGFLPYRNLAAKWKFLAFESWLRQKGVDPSMYRQNLGIIGSYDVANKTLNLSLDQEVDLKIGGEISADMKLEDLLRVYDQEKIKFLSSFVGQRLKVNVMLAERRSRKLIFSARPKEKEELVEKKKILMAKLQVGDVVKCCIKKITYFGIFVEVEEVPALIHQTEVSWDATLDPVSYFKIGQVVEAKVHQLDFTLERIFLSLKEITFMKMYKLYTKTNTFLSQPDPLIETLESVVGGCDILDGRLQAAQAETEWADVDTLIKELQQIEGIQSASKGRFFLSPGLAPTFQVYMASMFENQYKLLARSENKVREVIVQTSLGKEEMKSAILTCTNKVE